MVAAAIELREAAAVAELCGVHPQWSSPESRNRRSSARSTPSKLANASGILIEKLDGEPIQPANKIEPA